MKVILNGIICNSSTIRKNLESGQYDKVKEMLGRAWQIVGKVIRGSGRGKIIGYPTANIKLKDYKIMASFSQRLLYVRFIYNLIDIILANRIFLNFIDKLSISS